MNTEVVITCAVTGAGDTVGKHPGVPVTPEQIAEAAIEAAKAGAAIAHCHVRDPATGKGARDSGALSRGGRAHPRERRRRRDQPHRRHGRRLRGRPGRRRRPGRGRATDLVGPLERLVHVEELRPEICSLDCGSLNFGDGNLVVINTPQHLRAGARRIQELGVKPELEIFDTGNLWFAKQMLAEGLIDEPPLFQLCMGIPWGMPAEPVLMKAMVDLLPPGANWTGFGIGRMQLPIAAQAVLLGGHVRVGLEDNLYLERGVLASNAQLVEKAVQDRRGARRARARAGRGARPARPQDAGLSAMPRAPSRRQVRRVACIGAGVIGGGWAAHFLARGYDVRRLGPGAGRRGAAARAGRDRLAGARSARSRRGRSARSPELRADASRPRSPTRSSSRRARRSGSS